jgi:hypothetical protein
MLLASPVVPTRSLALCVITRPALKAAGVKSPASLIANLKRGETVTLPDGTVCVAETVSEALSKSKCTSN